MKYISKVILNNFQSHKYSEIVFDNGLNVIIGPSDSGKTAILRGIRWALFNEPLGDYFIREGSNECSVEIQFNDGTKVRRYRSRSKNIYYLYDIEGNEFQFEGFGSNVPEEVMEATGIKKILLDSDTSVSINLSEQLEGAFLLSERASTRANSIGRLIGVNIIDDALRESLRDHRNLNSKKNHIEDQMMELKDELKAYDYLDELKNRISKIDSIKNDINEKTRLLASYKTLLEKYGRSTTEKKQLEIRLKELTSISQVEEIYISIDEKYKLFDFLVKKQGNYIKLITDIKLNKYIKDTLAELKRVDDNFNEIIDLNNLRNNLIARDKQYRSVSSEIDKLKVILKKLRNLDKPIEYIDIINNKLHLLGKLEIIKEKKQIVDKRLALGRSYVERFSDLDYIYNMHLSLDGKWDQLNKLKTLLNLYTVNEKEISDTNKLMADSKERIDKLLVNYKDLLFNLEICPLCLNTIDSDRIEHIVGHYD